MRFFTHFTVENIYYIALTLFIGFILINFFWHQNHTSIESNILVNQKTTTTDNALIKVEDLSTNSKFKIPGIIESEDLKIVKKSGSFLFWKQPTSDLPDGKWSNNSQMMATNPEVNDFVEFELPVTKAGKYRLTVYLTAAHDYGIVQFFVNEKIVKNKIDLFNAKMITNIKPVNLGIFQLSPISKNLTIKVIGHNPSTAIPYYQFGLDGLKMEKVK